VSALLGVSTTGAPLTRAITQPRVRPSTGTGYGARLGARAG
jgi:hypothetical protein